MAQIELSDGQNVDTDTIEKVELYNDDLLITTRTGQVKVHGPDANRDADSLDAVRDQEHLHYLVFRKPSK